MVQKRNAIDRLWASGQPEVAVLLEEHGAQLSAVAAFLRLSWRTVSGIVARVVAGAAFGQRWICVSVASDTLGRAFPAARCIVGNGHPQWTVRIRSVERIITVGGSVVHVAG